MGHSCGTLSWDTLVGHSCRTLLWDSLHFARSTRAISAERCARVGQIALSPTFRSLDTRDLRGGLRVKSPKRAFRTRLSQKTHTSKSAKRAFRTRLPPKVKRKHPSEHTHHAALPSSFAIPAPPNNVRSHANPNVTATFTSTTTHDLTIPCARHESFHIHTSNGHKVLRSRFPAPATKIALPCLKARANSCACHEK